MIDFTQETAINNLDGDMLVSASAGSGKTYTMIRRIINIVLQGKAHVNELLAVTFTNQSAAEMKERLKKAVTEEINNGRQDLTDELYAIASASFCTIDSFCSNLIKTYFYVCGTEPDFETMDENESELAKRKTINNLFDDKYESGDGDFKKLLSCFSKKRRDDSLKAVVLDLYGKISVEYDRKACLYKCLEVYKEDNFNIVLNSLANGIKNVVQGFLSELDAFSKLAEQAGQLRVVSAACALKEYLEKVLSSSDPYEMQQLVLDKAANKPRALKTDDAESIVFSADYSKIKDKVKKYLDQKLKPYTEKQIDKVHFLSCRENSRLLAELVQEFGARYSEYKKDVGKLDFADLEYFAYQVLNDESVRRAVSEKYKYIFIDEYQDVNALQEAIFTRIGRDNLFMVGDLKQSIYGFRGCNSSFFADKTKSFLNAENKTVVQLSTNYRSADNVLNYCDSVFSPLMTDANGTPYARFESSKKYGEHNGECVFLSFEKEDSKSVQSGVYSVKKAYENGYSSDDSISGKAVAKIIEDNLGKEYFDVKSGTMRRLTYGDFAVLTRTKTKIAEAVIETLMRDGIPVVSESADDIREYYEIKSLIQFLRLLTEYGNDSALAASLKNIGGLTDEELKNVREIGFGIINEEKIQNESNPSEKPQVKEKLNYFKCYLAVLNKALQGGINSESKSLVEKVCNFDAYYKKTRFLSGIISLSDLLTEIIKENDLDIKWRAMKLGGERIKRAERFIAEARAAKPNSVAAFLRRVDDCKNMPLSSVAGEDCVLVSTIHKSKGLEYPVVIVCGLEKKFDKRDFLQETVYYDRNNGFAIKAYDPENRLVYRNIFRDYIASIKARDLIGEELRLFYVALTRAKYSLYLISVGKEIKDEIDSRDFETCDCFTDFMCKKYNMEEGKLGELNKEFIETDERQIIIGKADEELKEIISKNLSFKYPYQYAVALPEKTSVTAAAERLKNMESDDSSWGENCDVSGAKATCFVFPDDEDTDKRERGTAYHKYLELYDFNEKRLTLAMPQELSSYIKDEKIASILKMPVFEDLKGWKCYKEKTFTAFVPSEMLYGIESGGEKILVQGAIDLLAVKDGKARILDYKFSTANESELKRRYKGQLNLYAYAVKNVLNLEVVETTIVNLLNGNSVKIDNKS